MRAVEPNRKIPPQETMAGMLVELPNGIAAIVDHPETHLVRFDDGEIVSVVEMRVLHLWDFTLHAIVRFPEEMMQVVTPTAEMY